MHESSHGRREAEVSELLTSGASSMYQPIHDFEGIQSRSPTKLLCASSTERYSVEHLPLDDSHR